jgi:hypothetical protein
LDFKKEVSKLTKILVLAGVFITLLLVAWGGDMIGTKYPVLGTALGFFLVLSIIFGKDPVEH